MPSLAFEPGFLSARAAAAAVGRGEGSERDGLRESLHPERRLAIMVMLVWRPTPCPSGAGHSTPQERIMLRTLLVVLTLSAAWQAQAGCDKSVLSFGGIKIGSVSGDNCRSRVTVNSSSRSSGTSSYSGNINESTKLKVKHGSRGTRATITGKFDCGSSRRCGRYSVSEKGLSIHF